MNHAQQWTNQSVLTWAGDADPIEAIVATARKVVLAAIDTGWPGPPYDPFVLADLLGITVRGRDEVHDARTVPTGGAKLVAPLSEHVAAGEGLAIEFNPTRPKGRLRFNVAHEIAHTLFPDVAETIRHRTGSGAVPSYGGDDAWQLELLCNIAAGEFLMPTQDLGNLDDRPLDLHFLMGLRTEFDVSTEALLRRAVEVIRQPAALLATTPDESGESFRVDYVHASRSWQPPLDKGSRWKGTQAGALASAASVGNVSTGTTLVNEVPVTVQAVGVPPWPDQVRPRVLALLQPVDATRGDAPILRIVTGDATAPDSESPYVIAHVVNDRAHAWGRTGFAGQLARRYPQAAGAFRAWTTLPGNLRLGELHAVEERGGWVASLVAQEGFGPSDAPRLRYPALADALDKLSALCLARGLPVHLPAIGTGQAGGDWPLVSDELDRRLCRRGIHTTMYRPPQRTVKDPPQ